MKKIFVFLLTLFLTIGLMAQQKPRFSTQNMVGLLVGGSDNAPQVQTINGLVYRNWFTGIGTGINGVSLFFFRPIGFLPQSHDARFFLHPGLESITPGVSLIILRMDGDMIPV